MLSLTAIFCRILFRSMREILLTIGDQRAVGNMAGRSTTALQQWP